MWLLLEPPDVRCGGIEDLLQRFTPFIFEAAPWPLFVSSLLFQHIIIQLSSPNPFISPSTWAFWSGLYHYFIFKNLL